MNHFLLLEVPLGICSFRFKAAYELRDYDLFDVLSTLISLVLELVFHEGRAVSPSQL